MTEPPLNLDNGFTVSVYFPPGSDPYWVSDFLSRVADDACSMPSDTLDAFVVGHARDMLGIDDDRAEADRHTDMVNAPPVPMAIADLNGYAGVSDRLPDGACPDWCPCHRLEAETDDKPTACPTTCDEDCGEVCHEAHAPRHKRDHEPDDCPGYEPPRSWLFWMARPSWMGRALPSMAETAQRVLNDLAERGIRLVVPGYDTPPAPAVELPLGSEQVAATIASSVEWWKWTWKRHGGKPAWFTADGRSTRTEPDSPSH